MLHRRVLITGANKGIGRASVAAVLEAADDTIVLLGCRSEERGRAAKAELAASHQGWEDRISVLVIDVADDVSVSKAATQTRATFGDEPGTLYGIVNNAGMGLGDSELARVLEVNTHGPRRVCEHFMPLLAPGQGRVVNISSASGPSFVATCSPRRQAALTNADVTWAQVVDVLSECLAGGLDSGSAYGLSKAALNAYTIELARQRPEFIVNACTPGFIETDLTRPHAASQGISPQAMGMKPPREGTRAMLRLLFGDPGGSGWYFGSDAQRSPIDRYRSPGDPPYSGT